MTRKHIVCLALLGASMVLLVLGLVFWHATMLSIVMLCASVLLNFTALVINNWSYDIHLN